MTPLKSLKKAAGIGIAVLFCSASAQAAVTWTTWNLNEGSTPSSEKSVGSTGNQTTITAWGNTSGTDGTANAEYRPLDLHEYSGGLGAGPGSSPRHAIGDYGVHEFILLEFDKATTLTDLQIGWKGNDSDMTIMAFTGASFDRTDMYNRNSDLSDNSGSTRGLTNAGWELISNPMNVQTNTLTSIGNTNNINSSYWLIGSYNNYLNGTNSSSYNDFFKLQLVKGFSGQNNNVPLPTTAALLGLGLLALGRRRFKTTA